MQSAFTVLIRGPLGAGKTTVSKKLASGYLAKYISIDEIMEEHSLEEWDNGYIVEGSFLRANEIAARESLSQLRRGRSVILDGNFYYRSVLLDLIKRMRGFKVIAITLTVPLEVCIRRDATRDVPLGEEATVMVYQKTKEFSFGIEVDADRDEVKVLETIEGIIKRATEA